jgi:hypothetical protein
MRRKQAAQVGKGLSLMLLFCLLAACGLLPEPTAIPIPTPRPPTDIPPPTPTGPPVYHWERFDVSLTVLINGDLRVVERHHLHFAGRPFTFGSRVINHPEPAGHSGSRMYRCPNRISTSPRPMGRIPTLFR